MRRPHFAFGVVLPPTVTLLVYVGCALWAIPLASEGGPAGAVLSAYIFGFAVLLLAYTLASDTLALSVDARSLCLPGTRSLVNKARLLLCVFLGAAIALPALLLSASRVWQAWVPTLLVLAIALVGVLGSLWPPAALVMLAVVPFVARWGLSDSADRHFAGATPLLVICAGLALAVVAKWRRAERRAPILGRPGYQRGLALEQPSRRRESAVEVIRTCLGRPFARANPRRRCVQGLGLAACFLAVQAMLERFIGGGVFLDESTLSASVLALGAVAVIWGALDTLLLRVARASGDLAELALMPGLGDAAAQRGALYRAVLVPPLPWLALFLALACLEDALHGVAFTASVRLAVWLLALLLLYGAQAAQAFSVSRPARPRVVVHFSALVLYCLYFGIVPVTGDARWPWLPWTLSAAFVAGGALPWLITGRRLRALPHPFLS